MTLSTAYRHLHPLRQNSLPPASPFSAVASYYSTFGPPLIARFCHMRYKSLPFCQTDRPYPTHGVSTTLSSTYCPYTRSNRPEDVSSSKKKGPNARPMLSTTIQHTIRQRRYSAQPLLNALKIFQALQIVLNKVCNSVEAHLPTVKGVTQFKL